MAVLIGNVKTEGDKLTPKQKRRLLADIIQGSLGYDVDIFVGRPLSYYNWDAVIKFKEEVDRRNEKD